MRKRREKRLRLPRESSAPIEPFWPRFTPLVNNCEGGFMRTMQDALIVVLMAVLLVIAGFVASVLAGVT